MGPRGIPGVWRKKKISSRSHKSKFVLPVANASLRQIVSIFVCRSANFFINGVLRHVRERCPTMILNLFLCRQLVSGKWYSQGVECTVWNARALASLFHEPYYVPPSACNQGVCRVRGTVCGRQL